ncbi:MAG: peptide chain release factor 2 [Candidatus Levybacteria bacterium RIFCSPHIGHO2_01_FULL_40_15b]|nr:MAG: peptide chain release factor 2 [Candidatus Levybacteria bacterium RIFCSPHIGHO2_01_FULL_40_15b]
MNDLIERAKVLLEKLDIEEKKARIRTIEAKSSDPDFWKDTQSASAKMKEMAALQKEIEDAEKLKQYIDSNNTTGLSSLISEMEVYFYLSGPYDKNNAILSIHAGQGGADAMDWAEILKRMYLRYFEKKDWKHDILNETPGEEAGIKSVSISVEGQFAYGYLKGEQGTHRLVRLSPFNADKLRHTSFALVEVLPQVETSELEIKEDDLEWEFYRASSHGGQNVQKVSSAVRLKHKPTGITVSCQTERYQAQNRENALKLLKAKLWALEQQKKFEQEKELKGAYRAPSWGNQIRSYVLHPYQMVKDLRTGAETGNTQAVLDGDIDIFIDAELKGSN